MKKLLIAVMLLSLATPCFAQTPVTPDETIAQIRTLLATQPTTTDYTPLLKSILQAEQQLLVAQAQLLTVEKDTNTHVTNIDKTFAQTMASVGVFIGKYVAPAIVTFIAAKKL